MWLRSKGLLLLSFRWPCRAIFYFESLIDVDKRGESGLLRVEFGWVTKACRSYNFTFLLIKKKNGPLIFFNLCLFLTIFAFKKQIYYAINIFWEIRWVKWLWLIDWLRHNGEMMWLWLWLDHVIDFNFDPVNRKNIIWRLLKEAWIWVYTMWKRKRDQWFLRLHFCKIKLDKFSFWSPILTCQARNIVIILPLPLPFLFPFQ